MAELRVHLNFNAMASELEEVKRCMERKDKEKASLVAQVEVTSIFNLHLEDSFIYWNCLKKFNPKLYNFESYFWR